MPAIKHDDMLLRLVKEMSDVRSALRRVVANLPLFDIDNENTPAQLTADQNNYVPGNYDVLRLSGDAARNITGIRNGTKGRRLRIFNVGSYPITLVNSSSSSLAANRFSFVNSSDFIIPPSGNVLLYYDSTQARWIGGDQASIYDVLNESTPSQITANQNNYDPGMAEVLRLSSDAARTITGISGGVKGRGLQIFNVGSYALTLTHEDTASSASNRFNFSNGESVAVPPGSTIILHYDYTQSRWIGGDALSAGAVYADTTNASSQSIPNHTNTKVDPGSVNLDRYSFYDNTNNKYVVKFTGFYRVSFYGVWDPYLYAGKLHQLSIQVDGVAQGVVMYSNFASISTWQQVFFEGKLSANQVVEFYASQETGSSLNLASARTTISKIA